MKATYYANQNHLVIERDGKLLGFTGTLADCILRRLIENEVPIEIGITRKGQELEKTTGLSRQN